MKHSYLDDNDSIIVDDTVSYNRNMKKLMAELAKPRPVGENLEDLMKLTYPNQRSLILSGEETLLNICDKFPLFKKPKNVISFSKALCFTTNTSLSTTLPYTDRAGVWQDNWSIFQSQCSHL